MATMKSATIKIPVALELSLKDISSQITSMRKMLGSIAPNTNLFSNLTKQIDVLEKKYKELNIAANNSFSTPTQINNFENKLLGLEGGMKNFIDTIKQVNFEDFNLTGDQVKGLTELQNKIKNLDASIDELNNNTINDLFGKELGKTIKSLGVTKDNKPKEVYDAIVNAYQESNEKIRALNDERAELLKKQNDINQKIKDENMEEVQKQSVDALWSVANIRDSFVNKAGNYKAGGRQAITDEAMKYYSQGLFSEEEYKQIAEASASKLEEIVLQLVEKKKNLIKNLQQDSSEKIAKNQEEINKEQTRNSLLEQANKKAAFASAETNSQWGQLENANHELENYINHLTETKMRTMGVIQTNEQMDASFDNAEESVQSMRGELEHLSHTAQTLSDIKTAVTQWFGFNEVINFTKRQIGEAIQVIRDLDSAMTEIAVVTDMTQSDLWAQMDTYKSLAQQYGTTIKGVYEVSQLYY